MFKRKGMKIQNLTIGVERQTRPYVLKLCKENGQFFLYTEDEVLANILQDRSLDTELFDTYNQAVKAIEDGADKHIESKIEKIATKKKVIFLIMRMRYALGTGRRRDGRNEDDLGRKDDDFNYGYYDTPAMVFDYRVVNRVEVDGELVRYENLPEHDHRTRLEDDNTPMTTRLNMDEEEFEWSEENEMFFDGLKQGLTKLCNKLDKFFGDDNQNLLESIQNFKGNLLTFGGDDAKNNDK